MFNQLLFDTVPQSASFPFLKTAVQYRAMEMRTGKWLHWEKGEKERQKTEEKGTIYSQKYFQKEATAWDGEIMWFILTNALASTRSRQTWIEFHSSLTLITGTKCKMAQKKEKKRKCGKIVYWKNMNTNTNLSELCKCHGHAQVSIFQDIWNEKLLASFLRKKRGYRQENMFPWQYSPWFYSPNFCWSSSYFRHHPGDNICFSLSFCISQARWG